MTERLLDTSNKHKDYGASVRTCDLPDTRETMEHNSMELQRGQYSNYGFDESKKTPEEGGNKELGDDNKGSIICLAYFIRILN